MKIIATTIATDLTRSRGFFEKANWQIVEQQDRLFAIEKDIILELNPDKKARPGLKLYELNSLVIKELRKIAYVEETDDCFILNDPTGIWIYIMKEHMNFPLEETEGKTSILGNFAGISLECVDGVKAVEFYKILGLEPSMGKIENGWEALQSPCGLGVSIMKANQCPHSFSNPSFTYFNSGKNVEVIDRIRARGIPISEEITVFNDHNIVDNIIIHEPGGYGFFIFND